MMMLIRNGGCFTVTTSPCLASSRLVSPRFASPCPACPYGRRACPCFPSRAQSLNSEFSRNRVKALHRATVTLVIVPTSRSTFGGTQVLVAVPPDQSPLTEVGCLRCAHPHSPRQSQTLTAAAVPFIESREHCQVPRACSVQPVPALGATSSSQLPRSTWVASNSRWAALVCPRASSGVSPLHLERKPHLLWRVRPCFELLTRRSATDTLPSTWWVPSNG